MVAYVGTQRRNEEFSFLGFAIYAYQRHPDEFGYGKGKNANHQQT
jgi:hypothetical protein